MTALLAILAGGSFGLASYAALSGGGRGAASWLKPAGRRGLPSGQAVFERLDAAAPASLRTMLLRAGWPDGPGRFLAGMALLTVAPAVLAGVAGAVLFGPAAAPVGAVLAAALAPLLAARTLRSAIRRRSERLAAELAALLELLSVELSAGTPVVPALEAVLALSDGALAADIRAELIGSRVAGGAQLDERMNRLAARHGLPALEAFATILSLGREFGMAVSPGVRALAEDLVRERRHQVIASSRRALNRVLIPAGVGVLLPFMSILLFPAVITLLGSLR